MLCFVHGSRIEMAPTPAHGGDHDEKRKVILEHEALICVDVCVSNMFENSAVVCIQCSARTAACISRFPPRKQRQQDTHKLVSLPPSASPQQLRERESRRTTLPRSARASFQSPSTKIMVAFPMSNRRVD